MSQNPDPQQQLQYPQQPFPGYYYYYPPPPPKKDDKTIIAIVVVLLVIFIVVPAVLGAFLYMIVIDTTPPPYDHVPTGVWGQKTPVSSTAYNVDFGKVQGEPNPMDLEIILVRNVTTHGAYVFAHPYDGALIFRAGSGFDIADIEYDDLDDNSKVNTGDSLMLTGLAPQSDYTLKMIWAPTGDQITSTFFATA